MADLEKSRTQIPDVWFMILTFSLAATFYLTKRENKTKICNTALILLLSTRVLCFIKLMIFLQKNVDISKINRVLVLKGIFSETKYSCVLTYQISSFQHHVYEFQTRLRLKHVFTIILKLKKHKINLHKNYTQMNGFAVAKKAPIHRKIKKKKFVNIRPLKRCVEIF